MESNNSKWVVAGLVLSAIMLIFSVTQTLKSNSSDGVLDDILKVSMPRPIKEMLLGFSLEGRNIVREIDAGISINPLLKKVDVKPTGSATKAGVDKSAKPKAIAAASKARAQLNEQRRKAFQARVIEQAERYRQSLRNSAPAGLDTDYDVENNINKKANAPNATDSKTEEKESEKRTAGEWKSLILSQPTDANVQAMIKALPEGEIDLDTYLEITETLIKDNSQDKRQKGLLALNSVYRQEAFVLASHLSAELDATTQKVLVSYMYNYNRLQTLGILDSVLKSQDAVAATAAAQSITTAIKNIQSNTTATQTSPRGSTLPRTGGTVQQLTISSYQRLIPTLKYVMSKNLNNLSQWAQNLLSQLQTGTTTA